LEANVKIKSSELDAMGNDFEKVGDGFIDFLLLNEKAFLLVKLMDQLNDLFS